MYGRAAATSNITGTKAYMMQNVNNQGFLCADTQKGLTAKGATATASMDYAKTPAAATEPKNAWQIIRSDKFDNVYVYNLGMKKYLNPAGENWLDDEPYPFAAGISGKGCTLRSVKEGSGEYNKYLNINTSLADPFSWGTLSDNSRFMLLENHFLRPDNAEALARIETSFTNERLEAAKERFSALSGVPEGRIGSIKSPEAKTRLETLYNGGNVKAENAMEFIEGVENAELLELDIRHVYKLSSASGSSDKLLGISATGLTLTTPSNISTPEALWRAASTGDGATITSQGTGIGMLPKDTKGNPKEGIIPVTTPENAAKCYLTEKSAGTFNLSDHSYPSYAVGINNTSAAAIDASSANALWNIDIADEYTLRTNSAGVASLYVDFDLTVPEGQEVYTANTVTEDGIIKLTPVSGVIPARTAVLVKGTPSTYITFGIAANSTPAYSKTNVFSGSLFKNTSLKKNEYYIMTAVKGVPKMKRAIVANLGGDNELYIAKTAEMPNLQYYEFDFDDIIDGISDTSAPTVTATGQAYDLQGRPTAAERHDLYIINNKVVKK